MSDIRLDDTNPANVPAADFAASDAQEEVYSAVAEVGAVRVRRSKWARARIGLGKAPPTAWFGMIVILLYVFTAVFAPWLAPYGEAQIFAKADLPWAMFEGGDPAHFFGTDGIGRDTLTRLIYGARNTIGIAFLTTVLSFLIGGSLGLVAAIDRSWIDTFISRAVDVLMSIPSLIFALMLLGIFGSTITSLVVIIAILDSTRVFRLTRSVAINAVVMDYVEAARLRGEGLGWVMRREVLPNIMPPLVAEFGLRFSFVFLAIAALSFLGLGIQPPTADWGSMVREGSRFVQFVAYDWTLALPSLLPAGAVALLTVAVNFVVDWFLHKTSGLKE